MELCQIQRNVAQLHIQGCGIVADLVSEGQNAGVAVAVIADGGTADGGGESAVPGILVGGIDRPVVGLHVHHILAELRRQGVKVILQVVLLQILSVPFHEVGNKDLLLLRQLLEAHGELLQSQHNGLGEVLLGIGPGNFHGLDAVVTLVDHLIGILIVVGKAVDLGNTVIVQDQLLVQGDNALFHLGVGQGLVLHNDLLVALF